MPHPIYLHLEGVNNHQLEFRKNMYLFKPKKYEGLALLQEK